MNRDILDDIINEFDPEKFIRFFRGKNTSFSPRQEVLTQYNDDKFKGGQKIGDIKFQDNFLIICIFQVLQPLSEKSGKRLQYEKGKKILKETQSDAGIFIFYDQSGNFRFSLIYANYLGRRRDWSTFRRFTYFVSKKFTNKTFLQRIGDGDFTDLEKIKDAFSVEKVTKSFYTDIANWYFWAVQNVIFPKDAEDEENGKNIAVIRLITRLIFIWFMKERGLISSVLFDQTEISKLLKDLSSSKTTYYKAILQNLFFATLNTKTKERKYRFQESFQGKNKDYMDHSIYRYEDYFKNQGAMLAVFKDIPFLNGGLFDCLDRRVITGGKNIEIRIDGFTDKEVGLKVPNFLFFSDPAEADLNEKYGTKNKKYNVRGIINILSTYNFTIDENDPNDQEVALDPELLGKVFENLLASFNPETASTARNATGSYYTPREIVDYMVVQSLTNYFRSSLEGISDLNSRLEQLFSNIDELNPFNHQETLKIVKLIDDLRIVDPAVGSGAFPMGTLNKLVFILSKLDPDNTLWKATQIKAVEDNVTDPVLKKKLLDQVEEQFTYKNFDYGRKLYLIQKCIYGVDIQQIAVEIAKLRFFISLLVDEKIDKDKENWGIEPLPNLDYKIMQGNSLLEEYEGIKLFDERLLNAKLPDEKEITEIREKLKNIDKERLQYYQKNPQWMKNTKLERPTELIALEGERNRLQMIEKELSRLQQSGLNVNNQQQLSLQADEDKSQKVWTELQELHKQLFASSLSRNEKLDLKQKIDGLEWRLIEETLRKQSKIKELEKIEKLENSNTKPFFLWKLYFPEVFQEKGGFDIVIANPPYGIVFDDTLKKAYSRLFRSFVRNNDIYIAFYEQGSDLLKDEGVLMYISPNTFLNGDYFKVFRKTFTYNMRLLEILDFKDVRVFDDPTVFVCVLCGIKDSNIKYPYHYKIKRVKDSIDNFDLYEVTQESSSEEKFKQQNPLMIKIKLQPYIDLMDNLFYVKDVGFNYWTIGKGKVRDGNSIGDRIFYQGVKHDNRDIPFLKGSNVNKYFYQRSNNYLKHNYREFLNKEDVFRFSENFLKIAPKIIYRQTSSKIIATVDYDSNYLDKTVHLIVPKENNIELDLRYVLSLLNSQLFDHLYRYVSQEYEGRTFSQVKTTYIKQLPIKKISTSEQSRFIEVVDKILAITNSSDYLTNSEKQARVQDYEKQIDQLVYKLYGLTPEEIAIVEGN